MTDDFPLIAGVLAYYGLGTIVVRKGWQSIVCPFHDDETASASVNLDLGAFKCHACEMKGDALAIVMIQEDLEDRESAAAHIAEELGISDEEIRRNSSRGSRISGSKGNNRKRSPAVPPRRR